MGRWRGLVNVPMVQKMITTTSEPTVEGKMICQDVGQREESWAVLEAEVSSGVPGSGGTKNFFFCRDCVEHGTKYKRILFQNSIFVRMHLTAG